MRVERGCTRCGCFASDHYATGARRCRLHPRDCASFTDSELPKPGERPIFGVHRMPTTEATTAEAWPSAQERELEARHRQDRALRGD